jgi:polar amino acid transport system substrate-binding protein
MARLKSPGFFIIIIVLLTYIIAPCSNSPENHLLLVTEEWPPYGYMEGNVLKGFSVEIVQHIMNELKVNYPIEILPSPRAKIIIDKGPFVMHCAMWRIPEREKQYKWIGPIGKASIHFYKKKGSPLIINTLEDAKKVKRVSCRPRVLIYKVLTGEGFKNLDPAPDQIGIYLKVVTGRCDLAIGETSWGVKYWLRRVNLPSDTLVQTPVKMIEAFLYIACNKSIPDSVITKWQITLDEMKASGEYQKVYQRYNQ